MSNLLKDASILLTPTAYDNGSMLSVKPEIAFGEELSTNGDFSNGTTGWSNGSSTLSVVDGKLKVLATGAFSYARQNIAVVSGKKYKITVNFFYNSLVGNIEVYDGTTNTISEQLSEDGVITLSITPSSTNLRLTLLNRNGVSGDFNYWDNVSVKEDLSGDFDFQRNSAATRVNAQGLVENVQILSPELVSNGNFSQEGSDQVLNGDFSVDSNWTKGANWTISGGKAISNGTGLIYQTEVTYLDDKQYKVTFNADITSGNFTVRIGNTSSSVAVTQGLNTHYLSRIPSNTTGYLFFQGNGVGSIDNVSVKEVGQDWNTKGGKITSVDSSGLVFDNSTGNSSGGVFQNLGLSDTKKYRMTATMQLLTGSSNGTFTVFSSTSSGTGQSGIYSGSVLVVGGDAVTETFDFSPASGDVSIQFSCDEVNATYRVSNVSVKEVTDDTNIPRINYEGFSYQDSLGSEEVVNGDFSNGSANWAGDDATLNVSNNTGKVTVTSNAEAGIKTSGVSSFTQGKKYKLTFDVVNATGGLVSGTIKEYSNANVVGSWNGVGSYTISFTYRSSSSQLRWLSSSNVGDILEIDNVSVKEVTGQEVVPDSGCGSWLLEPQSTNLITYSEDFSQFSNTPDVSITTGFTAPDGTNTASKIVSTGGNAHIAGYNGINTGNRKSIYARTTSGTGTVYLLNTSTDTNALFTITEQWQRFDISHSDANWFYGVDFRGAGATLTEVIIWGAQLENQSYATSYIPTNGATNTRLKDIANNSGNSSLINSTEGVLYADIAALATTSSYNLIEISNGGNNDRVYLAYTNSSNKIRVVTRVGNSDQFDYQYTLADATKFNKIAFKYKENDFALWVNGLEVYTDNSGNTFPSNTLNVINFSNTSGTENFFGKNKALAVYKEALTDANLRCLTYPNPVATTFDLDFDTIAEQFTFTRGSEATFVNEQGLIESTNQIGPELVTNGDFTTDSDWNKGTGWTISGGTANTDGTSSSEIRQNNVTIVGKQYKYSFTISNSGGGVFNARFRNKSTGTPILNFSNEGTYSGTFTSNGTFIDFVTLSNNTASFSIDNVSIKEVISATNTPRIDYSTGAKAFLLEPQSTNLITYSEDFSQWASSNLTLTSGQSSAITASNDAWLFTATASAANVTLSVSSSGANTLSVFAKAGTQDGIFIRFSGSSNPRAFFNLSNGTLVDSSGITSSNVEAFNDGWYRISITSTDNVTDARIYVADSTGNFVSSGNIYVQNAQLEQQSYATSYIPTSGASATRNQELCKDATPVINSEEGTLYAEISALADGTNQRWISIGSGSNANRVSILFNATNKVSCSVRGSSSAIYDSNHNIGSQTNNSKVAIRYKDSDFAFFVNGVKVNSQTSGTLNFNAALDTLSFDSADGGSKFIGNTKGLKYYPKALADVQLEDLTTI